MMDKMIKINWICLKKTGMVFSVNTRGIARACASRARSRYIRTLVAVGKGVADRRRCDRDSQREDDEIRVWSPDVFVDEVIHDEPHRGQHAR